MLTEHGRPVLRIAGGADETPMERFERQMSEQFPTEVRQLDRAAAAFTTGAAALLRQDGTPTFAPDEHQERTGVLLAQLNATLESVTQAAESAISKAQTDLARLQGRDPLDALSPVDQARAAARREFISEDAQRLPMAQIAERMTAAIASDDLVLMTLWHRYAGQRLESEGGQLADPATPRGQALKAFQGLEVRVLGDPATLRSQRAAIGQRVESAKFLLGRVRQARSVADGRRERDLAEMRRQYGAF